MDQVGQTSRILDREFGIISASTRRTIYAIHHKFMETESYTLRQESQRFANHLFPDRWIGRRGPLKFCLNLGICSFP